MKRTKLVEEKFGGTCDGNDTIVTTCPDTNITCPRGCEWGEWNNNGTWSACSVTCSKGTKKRTRNVKLDPEPGGKECEDRDSFETTDCIESRNGTGKSGKVEVWTECPGDQHIEI